MPLIWHRWGILVLPLLFAGLLLTELLVDAWWGRGFYTATYWPKAAGAALGAAFVGIAGWSMNRRHPTWATKHRFFFLPMEYWAGIVLFIIACLSYGRFTGTW